MARNKALGRGLDALIPSFDGEAEQTKDIDNEIKIEDIKINPYQPRREFSEEELLELTQSIRESGLITPITVTPHENGYILIAGERRLRAMKRLGKVIIPAFIRQVDSDEELMELALIENVQRENLNPIEEAMAYRALIERYKLSQEIVAERIGKKRSTITNTLRLLRLPEEVQESLVGGDISSGHARAILSAESEDEMRKRWMAIVDKGLSVREAEQLGKKKEKTEKKIAPKPAPDPFTEKIRNHLQRLLGTNVKIKASNAGGQIEIKYYSAEDLDRILELLEKVKDETG